MRASRSFTEQRPDHQSDIAPAASSGTHRHHPECRGLGRRGRTVSYAINRACGDTDVDPAGAGKARSVLYTGRYTVHSPTAPDFGPAVTYPAVAAAADSDDVVGCSVSVAIGDVPADCVVDGALTRTLTWTEANPVSNFDFEFDITCGAVQVTTTTTTEPVTEDPADEDPDGTVAVAGDEVRIVARKLSNGKIEFGLQQQQSDDSWGDRLRPTRRFFPAPARAGRWLQSSPVALAVAAAPEDLSEDVSVRIVARRLRRRPGRIRVAAACRRRHVG